MKGIVFALISLYGVEAVESIKADAKVPELGTESANLFQPNKDNQFLHRKGMGLMYASNSIDDVSMQFMSSMQGNDGDDRRDVKALADIDEDVNEDIVYVTEFLHTSTPEPTLTVTDFFHSPESLPVASSLQDEQTITRTENFPNEPETGFPTPHTFHTPHMPVSIVSGNEFTSPATEYFSHWPTAAFSSVPVEHHSSAHIPEITSTPLASSTANNEEFNKGFESGFKSAENECVQANDFVYQSGYVDGASYGYSLGYHDAYYGRHFLAPSFVTGGKDSN